MTSTEEHIVSTQVKNGKVKREPAEVRPKEGKDVKFRRLALRRVPVALKRIRHVANLSNRTQYQYTEAQAAKIVDTIKAEVRKLEMMFSGVKTSEASFEL